VESQFKIFNDFGYRTTFIPESDCACDGRHTEAMRKLGVEGRSAHFFMRARQVIEPASGGFDVVLLCRAYVARELKRQAAVLFCLRK